MRIALVGASANATLPGSTSAESELVLDLLGPTCIVRIRCWLDPTCQPDPADLADFSRNVATRLVKWAGLKASTWLSVAASTRA